MLSLWLKVRKQQLTGKEGIAVVYQQCICITNSPVQDDVLDVAVSLKVPHSLLTIREYYITVSTSTQKGSPFPLCCRLPCCHAAMLGSAAGTGQAFETSHRRLPGTSECGIWSDMESGPCKSNQAGMLIGGKSDYMATCCPIAIMITAVCGHQHSCMQLPSHSRHP